MAMTQERADKIAYLICVRICLREILKYCEIENITELTAEDFRKIIKKETVVEIMSNIPLKTGEATDFLKFTYGDVQSALAKIPKEEARTIKLGHNPGTEINREIMKKRIGFTYGK